MHVADKGKTVSILPEGEQLRKAVKWISDVRMENPGTSMSKLIADACLKFDLTPKDAESLMHFLTEKGEDESSSAHAE